jgi:hypothetical protein
VEVVSGVKCIWLCLCFSLSSCEIRFGDHDLFLGCAVPPAKPLSCTAEGDCCTGELWGDQLKDELSDALADDPKWGRTHSQAGRLSGKCAAESDPVTCVSLLRLLKVRLSDDTEGEEMDGEVTVGDATDGPPSPLCSLETCRLKIFSIPKTGICERVVVVVVVVLE